MDNYILNLIQKQRNVLNVELAIGVEWIKDILIQIVSTIILNKNTR